MAHAVNLLVDLAFFLNEGVGPCHVGFGLVVVIVADEVFNRIVREKPFEFAVKLSCQCFVWCKDNRRSLGFFDHFGHCEGFAGARRAKENLIALAGFDGFGQFCDGRGLVACGLKFCLHLEGDTPFKLGALGHIGGRIRENFGSFGLV